MRIRVFRKEDAEDVSDLIRKCLKEVNSKDYSKKVIDFICNHYSTKTILDNSEIRQTFVAIENDTDKIVGTASIHDDVILGVFVNPKFHGKGIGRKLMMRVENEAKKKGFKSVRLPSSLTAVDFYKKLEYKKVRERPDVNFGKTIIMKKYI